MAERFTIEDDTLYFGRDNRHHGFNLGKLTDIAYNTLQILNTPVDKAEALEQEVERLRLQIERHESAIASYRADRDSAERKLAKVLEGLDEFADRLLTYSGSPLLQVKLQAIIKEARDE